MSFPSPLAKMSKLLSGVAFIVGCMATLTLAQIIEFQFFPVKDLKLVDNYEVRGADLWISGSFRKLRNCQYIKPVRAVDETGRNLYVISHNPISGNNWQPSDRAQKFGPWQIAQGAGHQVTIYQEYECHDLWNQFDNIAIVDARTENIKVEMLK